MKVLVEKCWRILAVLMLAVFLPVLFCICFIGNHMDYFEVMKLVTSLYPNPVLSGVASVGLALCLFLFRQCEKIQVSRRGNLVVNAVLVILFIAFCLFDIRVNRAIAYFHPWDVETVRATAYQIAEGEALGYVTYLSIYSNNIPISYLLGKLYRWAVECGNYFCVPDDIWLQANCVLISLAGYFGCLTVKKLTKNLMAVALTFFLYLGLVGASPWKMTPYTDTFGILFPIMCIFFYSCYRKTSGNGCRYLFFSCSLMSAVAGGMIKPSIYVMVIAVLGVELLRFLKDVRGNWGYFLFGILLTVVLVWAVGLYKAQMIKEIGLDFNEEIEATWQHYFHMGLNEDTTGAYSSEDTGIFGEFQTSKSERNKALLERSVVRLKEKGFWGTLSFWLRKLVMTFNDGTFTWKNAVTISGYYPNELGGSTAMTKWLRSKFWPYGDVGRLHTFWQLIWIFCLLGIPGICLCRGKDMEENVILIVSFLGVLFYQMLFEAKSKYLYVFLPLLIVISVCGIRQYAVFAADFIDKRKNKRKNRL